MRHRDPYAGKIGEARRPLYTVRGEVYGRVMDTKLTTSFLWSARLIGIAILSFLLALGPLSIAYAEEDSGEPVAEEDSGEPVAEEDSGEPVAEEDSGEPVAEEPASEPAAEEPASEPAAEEPASEPAAEEPASEPAAEEPASGPAPSYVPPPEALEGLGGWAVVDPNTGNVHGVIVSNFTSMEQWEAAAERLSQSTNSYMGCPAPCVMRFQTRATPDGNVAGYHGTQTRVDSNGNASQFNDGSVRWNESSGTFRIGQQNGDTTTSQSLVPSKTSRDTNGEGRTYNIGSGIVDIETTTTKRSGDTSAILRTYRSDYQDPTLDATVDLPDVGERGSRLFYELEVRTSESSERPSALDQISLDVDSILMEEGFATTDITVDEETGEESSTEVVDSSNVFVSAVREATRAVVDFLSRLLGFGDPRS